MPSGHIVVNVPIVRTSRTAQLEGLFDVPPSERSEHVWDVSLPIEDRPWAIGLIVGPSGSGKSTVARELFGEYLSAPVEWPHDKSVVDGFPEMSIKEITALLSAVGFSSPPAWLRPFRVLSTGEQFRVSVARALAEADELTVIDEFTSVVDRTVAQIGSAAVAKTVRHGGKRLIAVTCHSDVEDWLQPDWVFQPHINRFQWRELQRRPAIDLRIERCPVDAWAMFRQHHYLSAALHRSARCFVAFWRRIPVAFTAVLPMTGFAGRWREHRTVCLPDFQGVGIGTTMSAAVAALAVAATGGSYHSTTMHPGFIAARIRSTEWRMTSAPMLPSPNQVNAQAMRRGPRAKRSYRLVTSFRYVGQPWSDVTAARALWDEANSKRITHTAVSGVACS